MKTKSFVQIVTVTALVMGAALWFVAPPDPDYSISTVGTLALLALTGELMCFLLPRGAHGSISFIPNMTALMLVPNFGALITVGGGGGGFVGAAGSQHGGGGGSGGAILIEAQEASIQGTLLANGGAGGAHATGMDAATKIDGMRATSDTLMHGSGGGEGSGNGNDNGSDATWVDGDNAPGGGGGAGRIRVNTSTGNSALSAKVLSPSENGACATEGKLAQ